MEDVTNSDDSLLRYINVLLDTYPEGISQRELAERAGVTEPAVSKMKKKLYEVSVKDKFAFHEIVLSTEPSVLSRIGWILLSNKMFSRFILSRYGKAVIQRFDFYTKISAAYPPYARFFNRDETNLMVATAIVQLTALDRIEKIGRKFTGLEDQIPALTFQFSRLLGEALAQFRIKVSNEKQLVTWLGIRDKWYYLIEELLFGLSSDLEILKHVSNPEAYRQVYRETIKFYLARAFVPVTQFIQSCAEKENVKFESKHAAIGSIFAPTANPSVNKGRA